MIWLHNALTVHELQNVGMYLVAFYEQIAKFALASILLSIARVQR